MFSLTSIGVVATWSCVRCGSRTAVTCPVTVICVVLPKLTEWLRIIVEVTGG